MRMTLLPQIWDIRKMETRRILIRLYVLRVVQCYCCYFCSLRLVLFVSLVNVIIFKLGTAKL